MLTLLIAVVLGTAFAIFATHNTGSISLNFYYFALPRAPIYLTVLAPLLLGLIIGLFFYFVKNISQKRSFGKQSDKVNKLEAELTDVTKIAHKLQLENEKLKKDTGRIQDQNSI